MPAVFAFLTLNPERVVQLGVNCLAVAGGFLAGYVLTGLLAWLFDRWLTGGKSPEPFHRAAKIIGGLGLAILIAMLVFGKGGTGDGDGSGGTPGDAKTNATGGGSTQPTTNDVKPAPSVSTENPAPPEQRVRVTLLGGSDVRDAKFYLIDDDRTPKAFADVATAVAAKKGATGKAVGVEIRFPPTNAPAQDHAAVLQLTRWAQANGVTVSFPADKK